MLDLFQTLPAVPRENFHPKFRLLLDSVTMEGERKIISSWTEGFVDRDNKIVIEFQTTFHSAFWEFYLHHLFHEQGFTIDFSHDRPDFIVTSPIKFFVEAVVSNVRQTGRAESTRGPLDILANLDPPHLQGDFNEHMNEAIVRYANALHSKIEKLHSQYNKLTWMDREVPFVIALSSYSQVNYGREFYYPMMALLYGQYYDPVERIFYDIDVIQKPGTTSLIKLNLFDDPAMKDVSAVLFSCTVTLGKLASLSKSVNNSELNLNTVLLIRHESTEPHYWFQEVSLDDPEWHSDGLFVFHNPNATHPLPIEMFEDCGAVQIAMRDEGIVSFGHRPPIYSRLNVPTMTEQLKAGLISEAFDRMNS